MTSWGGARPPYAELEWIGNAKRELLEFPRPVIHRIGNALEQLQRGASPRLEARPMQSIGSGVFELKDADERGWYRVIYLAVVDEVIYVLHCFEKSGRKTDRRNLETAKTRLSVAKRRIQERRHDATQ
jgi:phage-related protein